MIAMNEKKEANWQFGRCPVCDAIVSLDPTQNKLCDRCYNDRSIPDQKLVQDYKDMFARKAE
jgi:hypothetical protein